MPLTWTHISPSPSFYQTCSPSFSFSSINRCGELHAISASVCCCPGNRDTKNRSVFFTPDISGAQSYCFCWNHAFSHPFNRPRFMFATSQSASFARRSTGRFTAGCRSSSWWWERIVSPVQHRYLILNVILFAFQGLLRDALDGHQPLGPLLFC